MRTEAITEADERLLDEFRGFFSQPALRVMKALGDQLSLQPTARSTKTVQAIREKLHRETIRLSQMQDIAGCRGVVDDVPQQDEIVHGIRSLFDRSQVDDLRLRPSHGYRAVHIVVETGGWPIEIQVRTRAQDLWAQLSEVLADKLARSLKYGGGPEEFRELLRSTSIAVERIEGLPPKFEAREMLRQKMMEMLARLRMEYQEPGR